MPNFETVATWLDAETLLTFRPFEPAHTAGFRLQSICVQVRDYKGRQLDPARRTLEAHYGGFVLSQTRLGPTEARRQALDTSYGNASRSTRIRGHEARIYDLGPEPEPGDVDGRPPAVVAWYEGELFLFLASGELPSSALVRIAESLHEVPPGDRADPAPG